MVDRTNRSRVSVVSFKSEDATELAKLIPEHAQKGDLFLFSEDRKDGRIGSVCVVAIGERVAKSPGRLASVPVISPPVPALFAEPHVQAIGSLVVDLLERVERLEAERIGQKRDEN